MPFRLRRATSRAIRTFAESQDLSSKLASLRCVREWAQGKIGRFGKPHEVTLRLHGLNLMVDTSRAELISYWEIWQECIYDQIPGFCPMEAECVLDVGANIGAFALYQAIKKRARRVIAFEPSSTVFGRLKANLQLNRLQGVHAINVAVGDRCGALPFLEQPLSVNSRISEFPNSEAPLVSCVTLDSVLEPLSIRGVSLMKIDTEGYEKQVLEGARETLAHTDRLIVELHNEAEKIQLEALLLPRGFHFIARADDVLFYSR